MNNMQAKQCESKHISKFEVAIERLENDDPTLSILNLNHEGIGNSGAIELAHALMSNTHLVVLFLDNNDISSRGATELCKSFVHHPSLSHVMMSYNPIGDIGAQSIGDLLASSSSSASSCNGCVDKNTNKIQQLKLSCCDISSTGARYIAEGLKSNHSLQKLFLENNNISTTGAIALLYDGLANNSTLQELYLEYNEINRITNFLSCLVDVLKNGKNNTIGKISFDTYNVEYEQDYETMYEIQFYLELNHLGRSHLQEIQYQYQYWPRILSKASKNPKMMHYLLRERPELLLLQQH